MIKQLAIPSVIVFKCFGCGDTYSDEVEAVAHTLQHGKYVFGDGRYSHQTFFVWQRNG